MSLYKRKKGGNKTVKSGTRWNEKELRLVLKLYLKNPNLKIHENNPKIHKIGSILQRDVRAVENQLLMFRNLDRHGDYGYGNMSKICRKLWKKHLEEVKKRTLNER